MYDEDQASAQADCNAESLEQRRWNAALRAARRRRYDNASESEIISTARAIALHDTYCPECDEFSPDEGECAECGWQDPEYYDEDPGDWRDDDMIDGVGFADPGGESALRAATASNPRNQPCPTCGGENLLTLLDVRAGYQCDGCARRAEGYGG